MIVLVVGWMATVVVERLDRYHCCRGDRRQCHTDTVDSRAVVDAQCYNFVLVQIWVQHNLDSSC